MKSCMQGKAKKREREINDYNLHIKWIKMNEFCLNKIINDFEWYIIAPKKSAKINDALFLFVKELSALACGFLALGKWQINWNDENRVARPTEQDFTQRLLGMMTRNILWGTFWINFSLEIFSHAFRING